MKLIASKTTGSNGAGQSGFTVTELIIVALISAIMCVIAVPQLISSLRNNRINSVNAVIASKLAEARMQAIKRNASCSMVVNTATRKIWIESNGTMIGGAETFPIELQIAFSPDTTGDKQTATFNSFGNLSTSPVTITVSTTGVSLQKTVTVSLAGKITVGLMAAGALGT